MLKWLTKEKTSESDIKNSHQETEDLGEVSFSSELTDADYDFLFNQLLEGVAHGWNQFKIIKFFQNLGPRGEEAHWVAWLERLSAKIPDVTNDSQRRLGAIMLRLAEVTQSAAELSQLSAVSAQMGKKLFFGKIANLIWEYDGVDVVTPEAVAATKVSAHSDVDNSVAEEIIVEETIAESAASLARADAELENAESLVAEAATIAIAESQTENHQETLLQSPQSANTANHKPNLPSVEQSSTKEQENAESSSGALDLVESWFNLGLKQANVGDLPGAIDSWQKALQLNPNLAEIWHNLGSALGRLEYYPEAVDSFNRSLEIDPQSAQAWNDRAHAFYQMEQWEPAVDSWDKAIAINPGNHQFWYHHGNALGKLQHIDEALASYQKALEISPDFQPARDKYVNLITKAEQMN